MFENQTKATILQRMLDASPADIDKREGSVTWDLTSPAAIELMLAYVALDNVLTAGFASTSYGTYLDMRAAELGITRKEATKAAGSVTFSGPDGTAIAAGTVLSTGGNSPVYFVTAATVTISSGTASANVEASEAGEAGNVSVGAISLMTGDLVGVVTVTNNANITGGADEETDAALLVRYLAQAQRPATSGNASHYRQWATEVAGVSDAKVYPVWNGAGTVKVVLLSSDKRAPASGVVTAAAAYIESQRPIGATVTVVGAAETAINVTATVTRAAGVSLAQVTAGIRAALTDYLASLAFVDATVRYSRIANLILGVDGVVDYTSLTVNGGTGNVVIADGNVAVAGTVVIS